MNYLVTYFLLGIISITSLSAYLSEEEKREAWKREEAIQQQKRDDWKREAQRQEDIRRDRDRYR